MFNIVQIQNRLQNVSKDDLIRYMQNPNPQVPSYLVLTELNRRNQIEKDYVKNNPPKSTVAQDLEKSAEPQGLAMLAKQETPRSEGLAGLSTGDMYKEENFATGGIVAFADNQDQPVSSNMPDNMFVTPQLIPRRTIPTMDDILMEKTEAQKAFGVDPDFYKHAQEKGAEETAADIAETKRMNDVAILSELADKLSTTPGTLLRGFSAAGPSAAKTAVQGMKDIRDIKRMRQAADEKLQMAQYAQARGDADAAQKHIEDYKTINTNIDIEEAKLKSAAEIANAKNRATLAGKNVDVNSKAYGNAIKSMQTMYPAGAYESLFAHRPDVYQSEFNRHYEAARNAVTSGEIPKIPRNDYIDNMLKAGNVGPAAVKTTTNKLVVPSKPPADVQKLLNKYSAKPGSRSKNTPEELNTPWDLAGQGLEDEE